MIKKTEIPLKNNLKMNFLSQEQFDAADKAVNQLYFTPDTTAADISAAIATHNNDPEAHPIMDSKISKYGTLPAASADNCGEIVEYTGETTSTLTHGFFYESIVDTITNNVTVSEAPEGLTVTVDADMFVERGEWEDYGTITVNYDGTDWYYNDGEVDLEYWGITVTGTPEANDTISFLYEEPTYTYKWEQRDVQPGLSTAVLTTPGAQSITSDSTNGWKTFFNGIQVGDESSPTRRVQLYTQDGFFNIFNSAGGSGIRLRNSGFAPYGTSYDLGTSDYKWRNLYLKGKIFAGADSSVELELPTTSGTLALASTIPLYNAGTNIEISGLPAGYTKVEYVESDGTGYIDLGVKYANNSVITLEAKASLTTASGTKYVAGAMTTSSEGHAFITNNYGTPGVGAAVGNAAYSNHSSRTFETVIIDIPNTTIKFNGATIGTSYSSTVADYNTYLFAMNRADTATGLAKIKLYSYKQVNGSETVLDLVPCKTTLGVYGVYDMVSGSFMTCTGLTGGPEDLAKTISAVNVVTTTAGTQNITSNSTSGYKTFNNAIKIGDSGSAQFGIVETDQNGTMTVRSNGAASGMQFVAGGVQPYSTNNSLGVSTRGWNNLYMEGKIITDNNTTELTLPSRSGTIALTDDVPGGGNDFTLGQNLEYIEPSTESFDYCDYMISDGTAAFWTNQYYQKNSVIEIDFEPIYGEDNADKAIMFITATVGSFSNAGWGVRYNSTGESLILQFYNVSNTKSYPEEFDRFKVDCIKKGIYRDGIGEIMAASDAQIPSSYNIMLFANNDRGSIKDFSKVKLRSFKHWKGGILTSWLVPAYKKVTQEYGLYDVVNHEAGFHAFTAATYHGTASPKILSTMNSVMTNIASNSGSIIESKAASSTGLSYSGDTIIGSGATKAYGTDGTTAYGCGATAGSGVAVGYAATAGSGVAIGSAASTPIDSSNSKCIAIGNSAKVTSNYGIAIGNNITASNGIAIGNVSISSTDSIVLAAGSYTSNASTGGITIGKNINCGEYGVAIGVNGMNQYGSHSITIGSPSSSQGTYNTFVGASTGTQSGTNSTYATAIGAYAQITAAQCHYSLALGYNAKIAASDAIQIGAGTNDTSQTVNMGFFSGGNYRVLNTDGTIPYQRLTTVTPTDQYVLTYDSGTNALTWTAGGGGGGGGEYILPTATPSRLGGVKVGSGLAVRNDGTLSVDGSAGGGYGASYDGGAAYSAYLTNQIIEGGSADSRYTTSQRIDGGRANM